MTSAPPIFATWDGDAFVPANRHQAKLADQHYVIGERYALVEHEERSQKSHAFYFASLKDHWLSLPEHIAPQFPSSEALRKRALILTGYRDSHSIVCASKREAERVAAFMRPIDEFAVIEVTGATVSRHIAKSQSMRAMGKDVFEASKTAVLDWIEDLIGVERGESRKAAA